MNEPTWTPIADKIPPPHTWVMIRGPQLEPVLAQWIPADRYKPCWKKWGMPVLEYWETVTEWRMKN